MAETKFVRVAHNEEAHFVALSSGLNPNEVSRLLRAAFRLRQHVIGLMDKDSQPGHGIVMPMSLACKVPQMLGNGTYTLLLSDKEVEWEPERDPPVDTRPPLSKPVSASAWASRDVGNQLGSKWGPSGEPPQGVVEGGGVAADGVDVRNASNAGIDVEGEEEGGVEDEVIDDEDDIVDVHTTVKIVAFIRRMIADGILTRDEGDALESAAVLEDSVVCTAFAVAVYSQDLEYLSALFKDIATQRLDEPEGVRLLQTKRDMLAMADALGEAGEVDEEQLMYLRNMILVMCEEVSKPFEEYRQDQDVARLAEALKNLCGAKQVAEPPAAGAPAARADGSSIQSRSMAAVPEESPGDSPPAFKPTVLKAAIDLANAGLLGALEAALLNKMVAAESPELVSAFQAFLDEGSVQDLRDAVGRAARIQAKRYVRTAPGLVDAEAPSPLIVPPLVASPGDATRPAPLEAQLPPASQENRDGGGASMTHGPDVPGVAGKDAGSPPAGNRGQGSEGVYKGPGIRFAEGQDGKAGVYESVPKELARILGLVVEKELMEVSHAQIICEVFKNGAEAGPAEGAEEPRAGARNLQELVQAAWGVYQTAGDEEDLVDSLVRIARLAVQPLSIEPASQPPRLDDAPGAAPVNKELRDQLVSAVRVIAVESAAVLVETGKVSSEEAECLASPSVPCCEAILHVIDLFEGDPSREHLLDALAQIAKTERAQRDNGGVSPPAEEAAEGSSGHGRLAGAPAKRTVTRQSSQQSEAQPGSDAVRAASGAGSGDDEAGANSSGGGGVHGSGNAGGDGGDDSRAPGADKAEMQAEVKLELMELVDGVAADGRVDSNGVLKLREVISKLEPRLIEAHQEYLETQDVSVLVNTLVDIAKDTNVSNPPTPGVTATEGVPCPAPTGAGATAPPLETDASGSAGEAGGRVGPRGDGGSSSDRGGGRPRESGLDREKVVMLMRETKVLEARDAARIQALLREKDPKTMAVFDVFDANRDVADLVETLKIVLKTERSMPPRVETLHRSEHRAPPRRGEAAFEDARRTEAERSKDSPLEGGSGREAGGAAETVVRIVESMGLDDREAAALRLAIACGDANVRGALEVFRLDNDGEELKDTLARVARHVLEQESTLQQREGERMMDRGEADAEEGLPEAARNGVEDDLTLEANEGVFQDLVKRLVSAGMVSDAQARIVLARYRDKDAVVLAALDVYKQEDDIAELVDTLKRVT